MKQILDRYFFFEFLKYFMGAMVLLVGVSVISKTMERLPVFLEYKGPFIDILYYFYLIIPSFITIVGAPALMFAISFTVAYYAHNKELTVIMTSGRSFNRIMSPILIFTLLFSVGFFYFNEYISYPNYYKSFFKYQELRGIYNYGKTGDRFDHHVRVGDYYIHSGHFVSKYNMIHNFHAIEKREDNIKRIIEGRYAVIIPGNWVIIKGKETLFDDKGNFVKTAPFDSIRFELDEDSSILGRIRQDFDEMNIVDIKERLQVRKDLGLNYREFEVELHWHYSFPFVCFFIVFIASIFGYKVKRGAMSSSIGISTIFTLVYYLIMFFGKSFAVRGVLPPWVGAWLANIIFSLFSIYLLIRNKQ